MTLWKLPTIARANLGPGINTTSSHHYSYLILYIQPLKMEPIEGSETSANYNRTPGKYPKEYIQYSKHGESLKSRILKQLSKLPFIQRVSITCAKHSSQFQKDFHICFTRHGLFVMRVVCYIG